MEASFGFESTAELVTEGIDLTGKTYLITGCNSGLGLETARVLGLRGANIIGAARTQEKAKAALGELGKGGTPVACELSDPKSVRACAEFVRNLDQKLDGIICNAGIMALPDAQTTLGLDLQFLTNHIGHFILVTETLSALQPDGRVVMLSSGAHRMAPDCGIDFDNLSGQRDYTPWKMYGQSKLANILFAKELSKRFAASERTANSVHPGVIRTNLIRHVEDPDAMLGTMKLKTIPQGAATQCFVATHPSLRKVSGEYFSDCKVQTPKGPAQDADLATRLWERSEQLVAQL